LPEHVYLIVNADDFGQSLAVNRGVIEAYERGIVRSTSLMVRWPAAEAAVQYCIAHPELDVGLHLDFGEWVFRNGTWEPIYEVVPVDDPEVVGVEMLRQLRIFQDLVGRDPTHIDSHQHVHLREPIRSLAMRMASELQLPLRHFAPQIRYCGGFYGQSETGFTIRGGISVEHLIEILSSLPRGVTELCCHPGLGPELETMYASERIEEVDTLCSDRVRAKIECLGVKLVSFAYFASK
jgi:predicted glycoside hydrolase/deacetylase ChbG (UPF0249 family)